MLNKSDAEETIEKGILEALSSFEIAKKIYNSHQDALF